MDTSYTDQKSYRFLHEILDNAARRFPQKTAIFDENGRVTYGQLVEDTARLAAWFYHAGCRRGDRIAIILPNGIPLITALLAASRIGAIFVVVNVDMKSYNLHYLLGDAEPTVIVTTEQCNKEEQLGRYCKVLVLETDWSLVLQSSELTEEISLVSQDIACLIYTSGSTGRPKAIISNHANMIFAASAIQKCLHYQESDIIGNFLPMAFDVGLYQVLLSCQVGATLALGQKTDVGPGLIKKLRDWRITGLPAVPSLISLLARLSKRERKNLPELRFITNTGAHLSQALIKEVKALYEDCTIFVMFGLTECKRVSILPPTDYERKSASVGKPLPGTECFIVDDEGQLLGRGEVGELVVKGPHVMQGYWRAAEMTAKRFRLWGPEQERVLFTGDRCKIDEDGYIYFIGRTDDIYKQGDYRVSALEIEAAACDISGVQQSALIPPNTFREAVLFILGEITDVELVREELRRRLEDYKIPQRIIILDEMKLTSNGKIDKNQLKQILDKESITA